MCAKGNDLVTCEGSNQRIRASWVCDGNEDCDNGADERRCGKWDERDERERGGGGRGREGRERGGVGEGGERECVRERTSGCVMENQIIPIILVSVHNRDKHI